MSGEEWLRYAALAVAMLTEAIAVTIVFAGVIAAAWESARSALHRGDAHPWHDVRLGLARSLALGLEFLLAADIVRTAVAPTWEDIGRLAAIAAIRTALNYFLYRELRELDAV